ncbi:MAG: hypothetical protein LKM35_07270 [Lachnospiraceae bacterium]|jgi:hypothetical protein|nr:hypothetical protein [Lachnospiraceae bacterium]MCI1727469.1 hypothetical protein [Lachnospiraceae bacterium]
MKKILTMLFSSVALFALSAMNVFADLLPESKPTSSSSAGVPMVTVILIVAACVAAAAVAILLVSKNKK